MLGCGDKGKCGKSSVGLHREDLGQVLSNNGSYTNAQENEINIAMFVSYLHCVYVLNKTLLLIISFLCLQSAQMTNPR